MRLSSTLRHRSSPSERRIAQTRTRLVLRLDGDVRSRFSGAATDLVVGAQVWFVIDPIKGGEPKTQPGLIRG